MSLLFPSQLYSGGLNAAVSRSTPWFLSPTTAGTRKASRITLPLRVALCARPVISDLLTPSPLSSLRQISHQATSLPMTFTLKPDFGKDDVLFPPLPDIKSQAMRLQIFTHRSYYARPTHIFEDSLQDLSPDNEKLEHLGDTVLGLAVTALLMESFPGLRVGPSTKIRAMVVANPTLAEISLKYRLIDHLRLHPAQAITLRASTNIQADVFEAFVGGLYLDQGLEGVVRPWLNELFTPYIKAAYMMTRQQHGLPPLPPSFPIKPTSKQNFVTALNTAVPFNLVSSGYPGQDLSDIGLHTVGHLALFNQHLQKTNRTVEWVYDDTANPTRGKGEQDSAAKIEKPAYSDMGLPSEVLVKGTKSTPVWYVKVLVDGEFFGRGRGNTKKAARNEAAKEGLIKLGIQVWYVHYISTRVDD